MNKTIVLSMLLFAVLASSCYHKGKCGNRDEATTSSIKDAKLTLPTISHACRFHEQDLERSPETVEELIKKEYLALDEETALQWNFSFQFTDNKVSKIIAKSTDKMPGGLGYEISYDRESDEFLFSKP